MEVLFAVTRVAKYHGCDKYLQWAVRGWFIACAVRRCQFGKCGGKYYCLRCYWRCSDVMLPGPTRYAYRFLCSWFDKTPRIPDYYYNYSECEAWLFGH